MRAKVHREEARRLEVLRLYQILDTAAEESFDDLTQLAADICDTPISLVSLIDGHRQWFKSRVGLEVNETPRDVAFCSHAIVQDGMFVVRDATKDERFRDNPLVTADPNIRFYAGVPLVVSGGLPLGTLCVIDRKPRDLTALQERSLRTLGRAVVSHLELRRSVAEIRNLSSLLSMCAWCRKIDGEDGSWESLEGFIEKRGGVTHGICPDCKARLASRST